MFCQSRYLFNRYFNHYFSIKKCLLVLKRDASSRVYFLFLYLFYYLFPAKLYFHHLILIIKNTLHLQQHHQQWCVRYFYCYCCWEWKRITWLSFFYKCLGQTCLKDSLLQPLLFWVKVFKNRSFQRSITGGISW